MADPIIIVDDDGIEHEFPAGFDPKKAGEIVRESTDKRSTFAKTVDTLSEPTAPGKILQDYADKVAELIDPPGGLTRSAWVNKIAAFLAGATQGAGGVAAGYTSPLGAAATLSGLGAETSAAKAIPGAVKALRMAEGGTGAAFRVRGAEHAIEDPDMQDRILGVVQALGGPLPGKGQDLKNIGPPIVDPLKRAVGTVMEKGGKKYEFPARMAGGSAIVGGIATMNPAIIGGGAALSAAPEVLQTAGRKLRVSGTPEGATSGTRPHKFLKLQNDLATGAISPEDALTQLSAMQTDLGVRLAKAKLPEEVTDLQKEQIRLNNLTRTAQKAIKTSGKESLPIPGEMSAADEARLIKQGQTPEGIVKIKQALQAQAKPNVTPASLPLQQPKGAMLNPVVVPKPMGGAPLETPSSFLEHPRHNYINRDTSELLTGSRTGGLENLTPGEMPAGAASDMEEAIKNAPHTYGRTEPTEPLGPKPATIEEALLQKEMKVPVEGNVPASKSKRGPMSATPGLTVEDAKSLGLNPDNRIVGLTPDAIEKLLLERAQRSGAYRTEAGLNAGANKAVALDEP